MAEAVGTVILAGLTTHRRDRRAIARSGYRLPPSMILSRPSRFSRFAWIMVSGALLGSALLFSSSAAAQNLQFDAAKILSQPPPARTQPDLPAEVIAQGYLYLETNQIRFEALFDATTIQKWADLPLSSTLGAEDQKALTEAITAKAADWCHIGTTQPESGNFLGASIIKGKPGATLLLEEGASLSTREAMVGLIWEFPRPPLPEEIQIQWTGYLDGQTQLPIRVFFGPRSELIEANQGTKLVKWRSQGRLPMPSPLAAVPKIETLEPWHLPMGSLIWFSIGLIFFLVLKGRGHRLAGGNITFLSAWLLGALLTWPLFVVKLQRGVVVPEVKEKPDAEAILSPLLRNVYRAFDYRTESEIYDTLARSVDGELLRQLYLETLQALTLEGREGTRVTITEFSAEVMAVKPNPVGAGFVTECQWTALGTVGHWGHAHTRVNRYTAEVTVAPVGAAWKVVKLDVREARRI